MNNKLTVFMPVYNGEKYLKDSIQSILDQTYNDFKFLIINDGSTDESVNIINSFNDQRIKLVNNSQNKGLVYTRNKGFELANAEFIAFIDSDDISFSTRIEEELDFLLKNPDYGICSSSVETFGDFGDGFWGYPEDYEDIKTRSLFKCQIYNSATIINANLFKRYNLRYNDGFHLAEDYDLWTRSLEKIKAHNIQKPLVRIRLHNDSICHTKQHILKQKTLDVYKNLINKLGIIPSEEELELHFALGEYSSLTNINNYVEKTENWLSKLIKGNISNNVYNSKNFNIMIDKIWFETCNQYIKNNSGCWAKYNNPIFKKQIKYNHSHKRKIFYRSITKNLKSLLTY